MTLIVTVGKCNNSGWIDTTRLQPHVQDSPYAYKPCNSLLLLGVPFVESTSIRYTTHCAGKRDKVAVTAAGACSSPCCCCCCTVGVLRAAHPTYP
jgi:hypothetical protein